MKFNKNKIVRCYSYGIQGHLKGIVDKAVLETIFFQEINQTEGLTLLWDEEDVSMDDILLMNRNQEISSKIILSCWEMS